MQVGPLAFYDYLMLVVIGLAGLGALPFLLPFHGRAIIRFSASGILVLIGLSIALTPLKANSFAGFHLAYGVSTWSVPAVGIFATVVTVLQPQLELRKHVVFPVATLLLAPAVFGVYATNIEPKRLAVDRYNVGTRDALDKKLRVVVISDIQAPSVGAFEHKVSKVASEQNGDVMLYAGDLYSGEDDPFPEHFDEFSNLISRMQAPYGTYFVPGDHDGDDMLPALVAAGHKTFLQEHLQEIDVRGLRVGILGLDTDYSSKNANELMQQLTTRTDLDYKIVLEHRPDVIFNTPSGIDLVVAGHTHGGQVKVPLFGPLVTLSNIPRDQAGGGLFNYSNGRKLFVSRGIGVEHGEAPVIRFNDPPQIAVLDINVAQNITDPT